LFNNFFEGAEDTNDMLSELSMIKLITAMQVQLRARQNRVQETGATAVEYGLMVGLMALVIILGVTKFGTAVTREFNVISNTMPTGAG
jgi:pilus assembly protein Flp/PilA